MTLRAHIKVTDHAVVRYLERVVRLDLRRIRRGVAREDYKVLHHLAQHAGIDVAALRREIAHRVAIADDHDGCAAVVVNGFRYCLDGHVVTTICPCHQPNRRAGHRR